jgi:hypothetical protein
VPGRADQRSGIIIIITLSLSLSLSLSLYIYIYIYIYICIIHTHSLSVSLSVSVSLSLCLSVSLSLSRSLSPCGSAQGPYLSLRACLLCFSPLSLCACVLARADQRRGRPGNQLVHVSRPHAHVRTHARTHAHTHTHTNACARTPLHCLCMMWRCVHLCVRD